MKFSTVAVTLGAASSAAAHAFDYNSAHLSKRLDRKPDSAWDFVTKGADLAKSVTERSSQVQSEAGKFNIANFNLRAKEVDPSSLGVDHVKQLSGYLDNDAEDKHLFYCKDNTPPLNNHISFFFTAADIFRVLRVSKRPTERPRGSLA